ncbi:MAG: YdcF family protein [Polyangiaceae bacterium]
MFFFFSKVLDLAFAPLTWVLVAFLYFAFARRFRRPLRRRRWMFLTLFFSTYLLSVDPVANVLQRHMEKSATKTYDEKKVYDAVILLGGVIEDRQSLSAATSADLAMNDSAERLTVTFELLREGRAKVAILSGGSTLSRDTGRSEAALLAGALERWGITKDRLILEGRSLNTRENALFTKEIVTEKGMKSLVMVTSAFHMKRAKGCFDAVDLPVDTLPVDLRAYDSERFGGSWLPRSRALDQNTTNLRELFGRLVYGVRGYAR